MYFDFLALLVVLLLAVCDCGTPWTFLLPFFVLLKNFTVFLESLGEERVCLCALRACACFARVGLCLFLPSLGVRGWLRLVIVALHGLFFFALIHYSLL